MLTDGPAAVLSPVRNRLRETTLWRRLRHKVSLITSERENSGFTGFLRLPTQFDALAGPVVDTVTRMARGAELKITVVGCSNGAEAYTIASVLAARRPGLRFAVHGYDINAASVDQARRAQYATENVLNNRAITEEFIQATFDRDADAYRIKPAIVETARFDVGDVLDPALVAAAGGSDIVFAQNFLFHLRRRVAERALENLLRMARPGGALFLDGTDLDLRQRFVRRRKLVPLRYAIEQIHGQARWARATGWPYCYWGLEPFMTARRDWERRYATIFLVP